MTRYAQFDPSIKGSADVIGWYDTDVFEYHNLPPSDELVAVSDAQWMLHFQHPIGWTVKSGVLNDPEVSQ